MVLADELDGSLFTRRCRFEGVFLARGATSSIPPVVACLPRANMLAMWPLILAIGDPANTGDPHTVFVLFDVGASPPILGEAKCDID